MMGQTRSGGCDAGIGRSRGTCSICYHAPALAPIQFKRQRSLLFLFPPYSRVTLHVRWTALCHWLSQMSWSVNWLSFTKEKIIGRVFSEYLLDKAFYITKNQHKVWSINDSVAYISFNRLRSQGYSKSRLYLKFRKSKKREVCSSNVNKPVYFRLPNLRYWDLTLPRVVKWSKWFRASDISRLYWLL